MVPTAESASCCYFQVTTVTTHPTFSPLLTDNIRLFIKNSEPPFLAAFLKTDYAAGLKAFIKANATAAEPSDFCLSLDLILSPLARLAYSLCITAEGQAFVATSNVVIFVMNSVVHGTKEGSSTYSVASAETLAKCAGALIHIIRDCPELRDVAKKFLQTNMVKICHECVSAQDGASDAEARARSLLKLCKICNLIEQMMADGRRHSSDIVKDVFSEEVIVALLAAYPSMLPHPRQLLSQLCVRPLPGYVSSVGHHIPAKALTSVLRLVASISPQLMVPRLFRMIEENLTLMSEAKADLVRDSSSNSSTAVESVSLEVASPSLQNRLSKSRSKDYVPKKDGSGGRGGCNIHIVGVLDSIPNLCIFDDSLQDSLPPPEYSVLLAAIHRFVTAVLSFEWATTQLAYLFRLMQRSQGTLLITQSKDIVRRMFAYQRSALMEVCRFASLKHTPKVRSLFNDLYNA